MAVPLLVALVAIPLLIDAIGTERFGLLAIIWMGVGYFSLFDMGLGRALTKLIAERVGDDTPPDLGPLMWTAISMILALGVAGGVLLGLGAGPLAISVLNVRPGLQAEGIAALRVLAVGLPVVVTTSALVGILEAHQRFAVITAVRVPLGAVTFAAPLATAQFTPSLVWATVALLSARVLALLVYWLAAGWVQPEIKRPRRARQEHVRPLLRFGGWLTLTNVIGPLLVYFDRFFIGATVSMTAVTYYVTPYEVLSRLQFIPRSVMGVMFPALATAFTRDRQRLVALYERAGRALVLLMLPVMTTFFLLAREGLQFWLGREFSQAGAIVLQWLALGWMVNTLARMPLVVLQSVGRPDLVAKTYLAELAPYVAALWILTREFGIAGTAAAWFLRVFVDTIVLNQLTRKQLPELAAVAGRTQALGVVLLGSFGVAWLIESLLARMLLLLTIITFALALLWPSLKQALQTDVNRLSRAPSARTSPSDVTETL